MAYVCACRGSSVVWCAPSFRHRKLLPIKVGSGWRLHNRLNPWPARIIRGEGCKTRLPQPVGALKVGRQLPVFRELLGRNVQHSRRRLVRLCARKCSVSPCIRACSKRVVACVRVLCVWSRCLHTDPFACAHARAALCLRAWGCLRMCACPPSRPSRTRGRPNAATTRSDRSFRGGGGREGRTSRAAGGRAPPGRSHSFSAFVSFVPSTYPTCVHACTFEAAHDIMQTRAARGRHGIDLAFSS